MLIFAEFSGTTSYIKGVTTLFQGGRNRIERSCEFAHVFCRGCTKLHERGTYFWPWKELWVWREREKERGRGRRDRGRGAACAVVKTVSVKNTKKCQRGLKNSKLFEINIWKLRESAKFVTECYNTCLRFFPSIHLVYMFTAAFCNGRE